jgi:hypothetical protein
MNFDKIKIQIKGASIDIIDTDAKFSLVTSQHNEDYTSEPYTIAQMINEAEVFRHECDLKTHDQWEKYQKELKQIQIQMNQIRQENSELKQEILDMVMKKKVNP